MIYKLKKYYIENTTGADQIITLSEEETCGAFTNLESFTQTVPANTTAEIKFPNDGTFEVFVDGVTQGYATFYYSLFESLIVYMAAALCDGVGGCLQYSKCNSDVSHVSNAITKTLLYVSVNNPVYDTAIITALQKIKCSAREEQDKLTKMEQYLGVSASEEILKIELAHIYLELYAEDTTLEAPIDLADLKELYNYENISYCIQRLGIMDCDPPAPLPGLEHTRTISVAPSTIALGKANSVTVSYKFVANTDTFVAVLDTNVPNVTIGKFDGYTYNEIIPNQTVGTSYYITYSYTRGGQSLQNTVTATTTAYPPQWFGGETTVPDFSTIQGDGKAYVSQILSNITNVVPKYQSTSNSTSSNTNTLNKYIWWITEDPVRFFIGAFQIPTGPWSDACDPYSYAIITKQVTTVMEDGVTEKVMHFYRTCPLQNLTDQTLSYTIIE